jgi:hypothetical protein
MTSGALERVAAMSLPELRSEWRRAYKSAPPIAFTADLLVRSITYRLQEQALGRLLIEHRKKLDQLAGIGSKPNSKPKRAGPLRAGSRLVRRWRGTSYSVTVLDGAFEFRDQRYGSLSEIARLRQTRRGSGPRFFGCRASS